MSHHVSDDFKLARRPACVAWPRSFEACCSWATRGPISGRRWRSPGCWARLCGPAVAPRGRRSGDRSPRSRTTTRSGLATSRRGIDVTTGHDDADHDGAELRDSWPSLRDRARSRGIEGRYDVDANDSTFFGDSPWWALRHLCAADRTRHVRPVRHRKSIAVLGRRRRCSSSKLTYARDHADLPAHGVPFSTTRGVRELALGEPALPEGATPDRPELSGRGRGEWRAALRYGRGHRVGIEPRSSAARASIRSIFETRFDGVEQVRVSHEFDSRALNSPGAVLQRLRRHRRRVRPAPIVGGRRQPVR